MSGDEGGEGLAGPAVWQDVLVSGAGQAVVQGSGVQNLYVGGQQPRPEPVVSVVPPFGLRPGGLPVRGREELLAELAGAGAGVRVLCGLGGCGKTRLALEVAAGAQRRGALVWWVSAGDGELLGAGMRAVGRRLGISGGELEYGDAADLIWARLAGLARSWLLVLDNADDPGLLAGAGTHVEEGRGWLRPVPDGLGMVLVTSRDGSAGSWGRCARYRVGTLAPEAAALMLADYAGGQERAGTDSEVLRLAGRLGGLPLAVKIAGSYLARAAAVPAAFAEPGVVRTAGEYLAALEAGDLAAVFPAPGQAMTQDQARGLIGRTWELTLDLLQARQLAEARPVLRLLASFADAPVPYELLLHPDTLAGSDLLAGITGARLWEVIQALDDHALIDLGTSAGPGSPAVARLHPLVRDTSRPPADDPDQHASTALAARLLQRAADSDQTGVPEEPAGWPLWQLLVPHAALVFRTVTADPGYPDDIVEAAAYAALMTARYQAEQGMHAVAETEFRDVLAAELRVLGPDHPSTLATRHNIAGEMAEQGRHADAETEYRDVLAARLRVQGPDHPSTLTARHQIAGVMAAQGRHGDAETEFRDVLAARLRVLGPDHPDTLTARHNIAVEMAAQGRHADAETEFRDVLAARLRVLGPDHPDTLAARHCIAVEMAEQGRHADAETEYRDVLTARLRVLGPDHPSTRATAAWVEDLGKQNDG